MADRKQTTIRIDPQLQSEFLASISKEKQVRSGDKLDMSRKIEELIKSHLDGGPTVRAVELNEELRLAQIADILTESVASELRKNNDWAKQAAARAQLDIPGESTFGERIFHFANEKRFLARAFLERWLMGRIGYLRSCKFDVFLVIDAGTTLYWLFRQLGEMIADHAETVAPLTIITNNIPGEEAFASFCLRSPHIDVGGKNRPVLEVARLRVLPGDALPKYASITGDDTIEALRLARQRAGKTARFIGLVSGNWARLQMPTPIPLTRGTGTKGFKEELINVCDETYLISPLGKIFATETEDEVNEALKLEGEKYKDVVVKSKKQHVKLVCTSRPPTDFALSGHSTVIAKLTKATADPLNFVDCEEVTKIPHMMFLFKDLPEARRKQVQIEFPHHDPEKDREFMQNYFSLRPQDWQS